MDGRRRQIQPPGDLVAGNPGGPQTKHFAHMAHRYPLCWHPPPPGQKPRADPNCASRGAVRPLFTRATSSRNSERNHLGTPSDIKSDWWATSSRIRGRLPSESALVGISFLNHRQLRDKFGESWCATSHIRSAWRSAAADKRLTTWRKPW